MTESSPSSRSGATGPACPAVAPVRQEEIHDRERRIGAVLGSGLRERLPRVCPENLRRYRAFLARELAFPFFAYYREDSGDLRGAVRWVCVTGLLDPELGGPAFDAQGLLCVGWLRQDEVVLPLAELAVDESKPNGRLIEDYWYWVWNYR